MDDIGLRVSAIPVLERLVEIAKKPARSHRDEQFRLSVGMKSSAMLAVWLNEQSQHGRASTLLRQAWHEWPLDLSNAHIYSDSVLRDRNVLARVYLSLVDTKELADEARSVEKELSEIMQLQGQRKAAK